MRISVILCTHNRCQTLVNALKSVSHSILPQAVTWEVLVVDNNSNDRTKEVVEDLCRRFPNRFRYLFERQPGKSNALNTGIREARGEVLAFVDDDVVVEATWLQNLTAPLLNGECVGAGGRILPEHGFTPPRWFPLNDRHALAVLALFDLGPIPGRLTEPPFGTNMAFQKEIFERYGGFRTDLGPSPGSRIRNEDTEFGLRLLSAKETLRYEPSAVVYHLVPQNRLTKKYFSEWTFDKGRADVREFGIEPTTKWFFASIPCYGFRRLAIWALRWLISFDPRRRFSCRLKALYAAGQIVECYGQSCKTNGHRQKFAQL
jgi:glycosyltransferase involved in cell wall biosynthesis